MDTTLHVLLTLGFVLLGAHAQTTLNAVYNVGGVTGNILFSQTSPGQDVQISLDLEGIPNGDYILELHEYRVNFDTADVCAESSIGEIVPNGNIGTASATSGKGTLTASGLDLSGTRSVEGRSFLVRNANNSIRSCATIEADIDYITAFAHLPVNLGGTVIFRQQDSSPSADTFMYMELYFVGVTTVSAPMDWQINSGVVQMDIDANTDLANRCGSTIKDMYDPDMSAGTDCTTSDHSRCKVGDLTSKHGQIIINATGVTKAFYGDLKLPLSGVNSIIGKTLVFKNGNTNFACANIVEYPRMTAKAMFSREGVTGSIAFTQRSPLDPVNMVVTLNELAATGGGYHVHEWPVPKQLEANQAVCDGTSVGGHFNPFNVNVGSNYPAANSTTPEMYEVGDLSGKFGKLDGKYQYIQTFTDPNLQLYGKNTIVGRSLVIHKNMQGSPRWICTTIWPGDDVEMNVVYARFTFPVIGYIVLRQPKDQWFAETQIYMELDYGTESSTQTINHNWHVHEQPMGDDMMSSTSRCMSVGGHYNPYGVNLAGDYPQMCTAGKRTYRCEVGDLSGKHGKLTIRKSGGGPMKYFFSDKQLPLSGPQSVVGKSITIHAANSGGGRLSCADLLLKSPRIVRVSKWSAAVDGGSPTGTITFSQDALDIMSGMTMVKVELSGLKSQVAGYHIHQFPTDVSTPASQVCQASDTGGHLNPFGSQYPGPASGTEDQYEIGDLSGKYNMLSGTAISATKIDLSMPLDGPYSIAGRSIVLHKDAAGAPRWACGNLHDVTPGSQLTEARATFKGDVQGYVHMGQYRYANGDTSDTYIIVHLRYANGSKTTGHNWHVHSNSMTSEGDCASCGAHYNPYLVDMGPEYDTECDMKNPLRCEVGDQAGKLGQYDIGNGKAFYTDVNLNIEGKVSAAKRSVVIHASNGQGKRIACANIVPYGDSIRAYDLSFLSVDYTTAEVEKSVSASLATSEDNILAVTKSKAMDCDTVTVYFLGTDKTRLRNEFNDIIRSNNHNLLGKFAPDGPCAIGGAGLPQLSFTLILVCLCLAKLRLWS